MGCVHHRPTRQRRPSAERCPLGTSAPPKGGGETRLSASLWWAALSAPCGGTSPKGEARLGLLQASGGLLTRLPLRGRYVPVGRCPAADRGGSRDAGTAAAVTERANPKLPQGRRKEEGQVRGKNPGFMRGCAYSPPGSSKRRKGPQTSAYSTLGASKQKPHIS